MRKAIFSVNSLIPVITTMVLTIFSVCSVFSKEKPLSIAIYTEGGGHHVAINESLKQFQSLNPDIKVNLLVYRGVDKYYQQIKKWMNNQAGPDVIFWYGGSRIDEFLNKNWLTDLTSFWQKYQLHQKFHHTATTSNNTNGLKYSIPASVIMWAIYYNQHVFDTYQLSPPKNWKEILNTCKVLRKNNVDLFSIGIKDSEWSTHGWFDYLNLRINGIKFYHQLTSGDVSYFDPRVKEIFIKWKMLIDHQCFNEDYAELNTWQAFPRVIRELSAMTLSDGIPHSIEANNNQYIRVTNFMAINPKHPQYTVQPINVFIVPSYVEMNEKLEKFLLYISEKDFQHAYNGIIKRVAPNITAKQSSGLLAKEVSDLIKLSPGSVQYFDRETDIAFASKTPAIFSEFITSTDINKTLNALEVLRKEVFNK